jgi:hypothetical protein
MHANAATTALLLAASCLLFAVGCRPSITAGEVYAKDYHPAWTDHVYSPIYIDEDLVVPNWIDINYPESWTVDLRVTDESGEVRTGRVTVTREVWDKTEIGQWFGVEKPTQ